MAFNYPTTSSTDFDHKIYYHVRKNEFTKNNIIGFAKLSYAEMIFKMLESCKLWSHDTFPSLHTEKWKFSPDRETLFKIAKSFKSAYSLIIDRHLDAKYKKDSITANRFLSVCLNRCGLYVNFLKTGIRLDRKSLITSLSIAKCVFTSQHFDTFRYCIPIDIWKEVDFIFFNE